MLTRQGWLVIWGGAGLILAGRILALGELYVFGAIALLLVLCAVLYVRMTRLDLEVDRRVYPTRVHAGQQSRVEIRVRNLRANDTPVLRLREPVSGTEGAELFVPPLDQHAATLASYRLPTDRRGILQVGPLDVVVNDPFGLARAATQGAEMVEVTVYPHVDDIHPVPFTTGNDPMAGTLHPHALGRAGDDFYALRPYVVGDDLRRIHWPSTARHDELLVRQHEQPWQGRTTVLLDVRRAAHSVATLDMAVSAAASIVLANGSRHDLVRLLTTDGVDSGFAMGHVHLEAMLEHLAVVQARGSASLRTMVEVLRGDSGSGGALVVVVAQVPSIELSGLVELTGRFGSVTIVQVEQSRDHHAAPGGPASPRPTPLPIIHVSPSQPFAPAWNRAMQRPVRRRRRMTGGVL